MSGCCNFPDILCTCIVLFCNPLLYYFIIIVIIILKVSALH